MKANINMFKRLMSEALPPRSVAMFKRFTFVAVAVLATMVIGAAVAQAGVITVLNPSFESPVGDSLIITDWVKTGGVAGGSQTLNPGATDLFQDGSGNLLAPADGQQCLAIYEDNASVQQNVGTILDNTTYTLTVALGRRALVADFGRWFMSMQNPDAFLASLGQPFPRTETDPESGVFIDKSISFDTLNGNNAAAVGTPLTIMLTMVAGDGGQVAWDNVRLTAETVPEPSTLLSAAGLFGLLAYAWRKRR